MSYAIHAFFPDNHNLDEHQHFQAIMNHFSKTEGITFSIEENSFTKKNFLKLLANGSYPVCFFFDNGDHVGKDLESIARKKVKCDTRLRILFGPDPANDHDEIGISILCYLETIKDVIIYSVNQDKIIYPENIT